NSTNQQTIGINKLGTLLSSQTTGTTDYSRNPAHNMRPIRLRFPSPLCLQLISLSFPLSNPLPGLITVKTQKTEQSHDK
ncbi:hypothetical protein, partial [Arthrobacter pityocampae]|uniref:hypothetical protein n=1 Tax=Arthrobacter pityocampae TaxID=547334 RepID=UPI0019D48AC9